MDAPQSQSVVVLYFRLPLGYGLYKERPLQMLCQWLDKNFR